VGNSIRKTYFFIYFLSFFVSEDSTKPIIEYKNRNVKLCFGCTGGPPVVVRREDAALQ
jgi:hypothetical protein